ncbi:MAG: hypothetical protein IT318_21490 [Anaerolineales bacterium]|nr:hypothetical protein [Anaerolineales bacterium]
MGALGQRLHEPVAVPAKLNGFFPKAFVWRGQRHDVRAVEDCRTEVRRNWKGQAERHRFRVRTEAGVFELTQDLARDTWHVERMWGK